MKHIKMAALSLAVIVMSVSGAFAGSGVPVWHDTIQLYASALSTTYTVTSTSVPLEHAVKDLGCSISTTPTATVTVLFQGTTAYGGFSASGLSTATTCSTSNCYAAITGKPIDVIRALITAPTTTDAASIVRAYCTVIQ